MKETKNCGIYSTGMACLCYVDLVHNAVLLKGGPQLLLLNHLQQSHHFTTDVFIKAQPWDSLIIHIHVVQCGRAEATPKRRLRLLPIN